VPNPRKAIGDVLVQTRTYSETVGIEIRDTSKPLIVMGDRRRLASAVANLVENALNFTAVRGDDLPSPIEVKLSSEGSEAVIEVEDHGIGIPERHQERIFERFYRVDRGRSRASGGTGLGLAIARHVVENHGGTISVHSLPGEGSTFRIELPAVEA
jgi:two-component system sensor histidine kinase SenX3